MSLTLNILICRGLETARAYSPPEDVADRVRSIAGTVCGQADDIDQFQLSNRNIKFEVWDPMLSY